MYKEIIENVLLPFGEEAYGGEYFIKYQIAGKLA